MCDICGKKNKFQEKVYAHNFFEQMQDFNGKEVKSPRKSKLTKKSLKDKIQYVIDKFSDDIYFESQKLENILQENVSLLEKNKQFEQLMTVFYQKNTNN